MEPKISVIVPVYNVEQVLSKCVDSICNQTYKNLEIILVDDGSPDKCPLLCDDYAKKDARIRVLHKANGGLSSARNAGLTVATGDYVTFIDSDDWIALERYEYEIGLLKKYDADVTQSEYLKVHSYEDVKIVEIDDIDVFDGKSLLEYYLRQSTLDGSYSVCRCLFPSYAIENERFREGKINEDIDFKYRVLSKCKRMVRSRRHLYFYYQQECSLSSGGLKKRDFDLYDTCRVLINLTKDETFGDIKFLAEVKNARTPMSLLCKIAYWGIKDATIDKKKTVQRLTSEIRQGLPILLKAPMPLSRKVLSVLFAINYTMTEKLIHFAKWLSR